MKVVYSQPVDYLSGWNGYPNGLVAMRSNGIDILRRYVVPANPKTDEQIAARLIFTLSSQNFKALTDGQRATWSTWAQIATIQVMGKTISLQDLPMYQSVDFYKYLNDTAHGTTAPTSLPGFTGTTIGTVAYDSGTTTLSFQLTHNGVATEGYWVTKVTSALASAQRYARPTDFRLIEGVSANSVIDVDASPQTMTFTAPVKSWTDGQWLEIEVLPLGEDYSSGTPFRWRGQVTVT